MRQINDKISDTNTWNYHERITLFYTWEIAKRPSDCVIQLIVTSTDLHVIILPTNFKMQNLILS